MPWQPRNKYCWDFWFAWQGQILHAFYLQAAKIACAYNPERRHNLASVGHAVLTDFGWQEINPEQPAFSSRNGNFWDNLSIWTGSIIEKDSRYYMFYTARCTFDRFVQTNYELRQPQNIGVAESQDLITWHRTTASKQNPVIPNPGRGSEFDGVSWRDPYVIKDDTNQQFYAFICACPIDAPVDAGGAVAYATSPDLEDWQTKPDRILYKSPEFHYLEVPQVFWRKMPHQNYWRLYLMFSPYWNRFFERREPRGTYYVRSVSIADREKVSYDNIPWEDEPANLLVDGFYGGKLVNPENDTPVFFGFQLVDEGGHFVGGLSDPKWVIFADDGTMRLSDFKLRTNV
jgi:beta-fructofuranosidase